MGSLSDRSDCVIQSVFASVIFILMNRNIWHNENLRNWSAFFFYTNYVLMLVLCFVFYAFYTLQLVITMFHKHDLAFKRHAPRLIPLILITMAAISIVSSYTFIDFGFYFCFNVLKDDFSKGFCRRQADRYFERNVYFSNSLIFFRVLPIIAFLLLNWPHDCYRCLGKDPDRIFSIK